MKTVPCFARLKKRKLFCVICAKQILNIVGKKFFVLNYAPKMVEDTVKCNRCKQLCGREEAMAKLHRKGETNEPS